jgi:ankyrin repeat protein
MKIKVVCLMVLLSISGIVIGQNIFKMFEKGDEAKFKETIQKKPSLVSKQNSDGLTIIHLLSSSETSQSTEYLKIIFECVKDIPINILSMDGYTPLMYACLVENIENVKLLVEHHADVNVFGKNRITALYFSYNNADIVDYLIKQGANINAKVASGRTPLMIAVSKGKYPAVQKLLENGADLSLRDETGFSAMHFACGQPYSDDSKISVSPELLELLIKSGANVDITDFIGLTPLMVATREGLNNLVTILIEQGVNINQQDSHGFTALFFAAYNNSTDILKNLVNHNADINIVDFEGVTPLKYAIMNNSKESIDYLKSINAK